MKHFMYRLGSSVAGWAIVLGVLEALTLERVGGPLATAVLGIGLGVILSAPWYVWPPEYDYVEIRTRLLFPLSILGWPFRIARWAGGTVLDVVWSVALIGRQ